MSKMRTSTRRLVVVGAATVAAVGSTLVAVHMAQAAAGCRVDYAVTNQWQGGFGASVTINNLGDPVNGWRLTWTFSAGQTITQLWNGTVSQSGSSVTVSNAGYNASIPTNGSTNFGFNGSWTGSNPVPASFALNGTTCSGAVTTTAATTPRTTAPTTATTRPPTTSATTRPPTTGPTSTPGTPPASYPNPMSISGSTGAHDPTIAITASGTYIAAVTGNGIPLKTSRDLVSWTSAGSAFPNGTSWANTYTGGSATLWAPDISYHNGQFYMYYAASTFGSSHSGIFLATSSTGASGSWTNRGLVIETTSSSNYNAIDPNLVIDTGGQWWLNFGSFWSGIKMIRLDSSTGMRSGSDLLSLASRGGGAIEAPFIYRHGSYYYLFVSFDQCCNGAASTYRIMVGRSTSITGPYTDRNGTAMMSSGGTQVLAGHGSIHGPGHEAVINANGSDILVYHYYADSGASYLGLNRMGWDSAGWPFAY